ncbi:MAG: PAS domain S-box protein, partial [Nitrospira sp.]
MDEVRTFWIIAAANVLLVAPLIFFLIQTSRRARTGRVLAEAERIRFQENEQRLRSMLEAEPHGILVIGLDYRVLQLNPAGCLLFDAGFSEEIVGTDVRTYIQTNDCLQIEEMHRAAKEGRETCGKGRLIGLAGQVRWVEVTFVPLPASDGAVHAVLSVVRDVTEQRRADRRQALQHAVAKVLAGASTVEQAVPDLLQALVVNLDWHVGLFWRVQDDWRTIICTQDWAVDTTMVQEFMRRGRQVAHTAGSDLPGLCWARGEPLWVEDVTRDPLFTRGPVDARGMLHAACAFPIWLRAHVYGVIELFSSEPQAKDWDLLRTLGTVGRQIGLFVERTEVEAALHENEARTSLIIDTALDAVMTMDRTGRITEWNVQAELVFGWSAHEVIG